MESIVHHHAEYPSGSGGNVEEGRGDRLSDAPTQPIHHLGAHKHSISENVSWHIACFALDFAKGRMHPFGLFLEMRLRVRTMTKRNGHEDRGKSQGDHRGGEPTGQGHKPLVSISRCRAKSRFLLEDNLHISPQVQYRVLCSAR